MKASPSRGRLRALLSGKDRRSTGRANQIAAMLLAGDCRVKDVVDLLHDPDPMVSMRAADALEKASLPKPDLIAGFRRELIELLVQARQPELRWHLAQMVPRLPLTSSNRKRVAHALTDYLNDRSSIVKTWAWDALARLAAQDTSLRAEIADVLEKAFRAATPAMRARARQLRKQGLLPEGSFS